MKRYPKYKNSGIQFIGLIPDTWNVAKMKYVADLFTGNSLNDAQKEQYSQWCDNALPYIATKDITTGSENADYENGICIPIGAPKFKVAPKDSFLICVEGGSAGKKMTYLDRDVCFVNKLCCFVSRIHPKYHYYYIQSSPFFSTFKQAMQGLIGGVSISDLQNFAVPVPSLDEQKAIASYLDDKTLKMDQCIKLLEMQKSNLTKYRKALISETVTRGLHLGVNMSDSGIPWIGLIPDGWDIIRVKYLLEERKVRSIDGLEEPLSMSQKYGLIPTKEMDSIPNMATSFVGAKLVYVGDLVFNKLKAHLGVFSVSKYDGLVSPDYAVYYSNGECNVKFLEYLFKTDKYITEFKKLSTGVGEGLTRLYTGSLFGMYAVQPPLSEQQEIVDYLDSKTAKIDEAIKRIDEQITDLRAYRTALISDVVTGKIDVRNN